MFSSIFCRREDDIIIPDSTTYRFCVSQEKDFVYLCPELFRGTPYRELNIVLIKLISRFRLLGLIAGN